MVILRFACLHWSLVLLVFNAGFRHAVLVGCHTSRVLRVAGRIWIDPIRVAGKFPVQASVRLLVFRDFVSRYHFGLFQIDVSDEPLLPSFVGVEHQVTVFPLFSFLCCQNLLLSFS